MYKQKLLVLTLSAVVAALAGCSRDARLGARSGAALSVCGRKKRSLGLRWGFQGALRWQNSCLLASSASLLCGATDRL